MSWRIASCDGCGRDNPVQIILKDEVWFEIAPHPTDLRNSGILCWGCMEDRLGRSLTLDDLKPCGVTDTMLVGAAIGRRTHEQHPWELTPCIGFQPERRRPMPFEKET